jgi:hypothetical protein
MNPGIAALVAIGLVVILACVVVLRRRAKRESSREDATLSLGTRLSAWTEPTPHSPVVESTAEPTVETTGIGAPECNLRVDDDDGEQSEQSVSVEVRADPLSSTTQPVETRHAAVEITLDGATVALSEDTEEHGRLRAYADTLLKDLKAARRASR